MSNNMIRALIVEDDLTARTMLAEYLKAQQWVVRECSEANRIFDMVAEEPVDLIFLDLHLPGADGQTLCKTLRKQGDVGIIFTTSCDDPIEKIIALENGADAYYVKPLPLREILACSKNLVQRIRSSASASVPATEKSYRFTNWEFSDRDLTIRGESGSTLSLTRNEARVLNFMIQHANQPLSREKLGKLTGRTEWNPEDRGIDVLVSKLRGKLTQISGDSQLIKTQYGVGYLFNAGNQD
ncbi:response regulator transcription factor [Parendozoicomonas haliclonae]|uniref:Aerobic respiration control protein ArcA n=1 Tax=Parendozoicomonas haliclonae TaxID=1960125 RepID=A0A1X7ANV4_9GAMM|nr:response regulator transcription factor [Parendozoicomonas haliclonae]SMA49966.1 Aerobic respiration control protein ArcA [Parendozoicomonas haliclonae]